MNSMLRSVLFFVILLFALALAGGCGGGSSSLVAIGDPRPGDVITSPEPGQQALNDADFFFNSGDYHNAIYEYQKAAARAETDARRAKAYEGLAWSLAKNGSPIGDSTTDSVILTFEKIGEARLMDWTNTSLYDARAGLAFALMSRNAAGDVDRARKLIERIAPDLSNPAAPAFNPYFAYLPERGNGLTNGMVHALLAYAYFLLGNTDAAKSQIEYAYQREPNGQFVREMRTNLTLLGLFN